MVSQTDRQIGILLRFGSLPVAVDLTDEITKTIVALARRQLECSMIWTTMEHVPEQTCITQVVGSKETPTGRTLFPAKLNSQVSTSRSESILRKIEHHDYRFNNPHGRNQRLLVAVFTFRSVPPPRKLVRTR